MLDCPPAAPRGVFSILETGSCRSAFLRDHRIVGIMVGTVATDLDLSLSAVARKGRSVLALTG